MAGGRPELDVLAAFGRGRIEKIRRRHAAERAPVFEVRTPTRVNAFYAEYTHRAALFQGGAEVQENGF